MVKRSRSESLSSVSDAESPFLVTERASHRASPTSTEHSSRATKISHLDASSALDEQPAVMICYLPPHQPLDFATFEDYDVHYQKSHVNRCQECHKNFPSDHYLGLHIAEHHDPLNEIKRSRGEKTYACFVSDCDRVCSTPHKRRLHLIDKHQFPKYYDFFVINDGIDKRNSLLRTGHSRRRSSVATTGSTTARQRAASNATVNAGKKGTSVKDAAMHVEEGDDESDEESEEDEVAETVPAKEAGKGKEKAPVDEGVDSITSSMSSLKFVPSSVRFGRGRGRGRGGFASS